MDSANDWEAMKRVYPIYVEISPVGACNHRCSFCALDYMGYKPIMMDHALIGERLREMAEHGVRSLHLAGEGEPLLHKRLTDIINIARAAGMDIGITTNATVLPDRFIEEGLANVQWLKASINAGRSETYDLIHRGKPGDFEKALENLSRAVEHRNREGLKTTLGAQAVLLPENSGEMRELANICRDQLGLDYLVIKPYSQHSFSHTNQYEGLDYDDYLGLEKELSAFSTDDFSLIFRAKTMEKYSNSAPPRYTTCYATPAFWAYVASDGAVYSCSAYLSDERFCLGNLNENTFRDIWEGEMRRKNYEIVRGSLDISECRRNCRMDAINHYLFDLLEDRVEHKNFI
ncbi:MAG: radical SAM protein [Sedimenticola sp.]